MLLIVPRRTEAILSSVSVTTGNERAAVGAGRSRCAAVFQARARVHRCARAGDGLVLRPKRLNTRRAVAQVPQRSPTARGALLLRTSSWRPHALSAARKTGLPVLPLRDRLRARAWSFAIESRAAEARRPRDGRLIDTLVWASNWLVSYMDASFLGCAPFLPQQRSSAACWTLATHNYESR